MPLPTEEEEEEVVEALMDGLTRISLHQPDILSKKVEFVVATQPKEDEMQEDDCKATLHGQDLFSTNLCIEISQRQLYPYLNYRQSLSKAMSPDYADLFAHEKGYPFTMARNICEDAKLWLRNRKTGIMKMTGAQVAYARTLANMCLKEGQTGPYGLPIVSDTKWRNVGLPPDDDVEVDKKGLLSVVFALCDKCYVFLLVFLGTGLRRVTGGCLFLVFVFTRFWNTESEERVSGGVKSTPLYSAGDRTGVS